MDFEEANSQVDSLCGALPRDDLRMHKCIKSDISKVMYQMKCMYPLHASPTINLSGPNQTSKMLVVIQIQTVRHTYGIGWYWHQSCKQIDTPEKIRVSFIFSWRY